MLRWICVATSLYVVFSAGVAAADTVTLRNRIEANGPMVTLGDAFVGTGALSGRAIAPAPPAGQIGSLPVAVLAAAASGAGLDWTPPAGVDAVQVVHPAGARATVPVASTAQSGNGATSTSYTPPASSMAIRRGDAVMLTYQSGGIMLSMRTQAMQDAAIGQSVRLTNPSSNRVVLGVVTGPGAASASP